LTEFFCIFFRFPEGEIFCLARLGIFFLPNFFSEMRSWLLDFFGPSITVRSYSITGFTLVLMGGVSVCRPFCLPKVVQNLPVLPALRLPRCLPAVKACRLPCCPY
jgi:hypothetical protein